MQKMRKICRNGPERSLRYQIEQAEMPDNQMLTEFEKPEQLTLITSAGQRYIYILVTASIVTALLIGPLTLLGINDPEGPWSWFLAVVFIIAIESAVVGWWLTLSRPRINHYWYRISEIVVLMVVLRLISWGIGGGLPGETRLEEFIVKPSLIFDLRFLVILALGIIAWERSSRFSSLLADLTLSHVEIEYYSIPIKSRRDSKLEIAPKHREPIARSFYRSWITGGFFLVVSAVLTTVDLSTTGASSVNLRTISRIGLADEILAALLIYFVGGFWLVSQSRYLVLQARWLINGMQPDRPFGTAWKTWTSIILLIAAVIAAFLPIGSTISLSRLLNSVIGLLLSMLNIFMALLSYVIFLVLSLFSTETEFEAFEALDVSGSLPTAESLSPSSVIPPAITTGLFWIIAIAVILLSISFVIRNRSLQIETLAIALKLQFLFNWIRGIFKTIGGYGANVPKVWSRFSGILPKDISSDSPWRYVRIRSLSPRDQVRFYYLSIIRRAAGQGIARNPPDTPIEYSKSLESAWPEEESSVEELTSAFVKSRYGTEDFSSEELHTIRETFKKLRTAIRKMKNTDDESTSRGSESRNSDN